MTRYDQSIIVVTAGERPTHGYDVGQLLYDQIENQFYELTGRNTHTWSKIGNPLNLFKDITLNGKYGRYEANGMEVRGNGMMGDLQPIGATVTVNGMDAAGTSQAMATGTDAIRSAGVQIIRPVGTFAGLSRFAFLPSYTIRNTPQTRTATTDTSIRYYTGYITNTTGIANSDNPLVQTDGGIVCGYNSTDQTWQVWHGDGTNPITKVALSPTVNVPIITTGWIVEMKFISSSSITVSVYNSTGTLQGSTSVTTNLPVSTKSVNWQTVVQNPAQTSKSITFYSGYMEATK